MAKKAPPAKKPAPPVAAKKAAPEVSELPAEEAEEEVEEDPEAEAERANEEAEEEAEEDPEAEEGEAENEEGSDFDNLLDAIRAVDPKFGQTAKEDDQIFFKRMITAISEFPEDPDDADSCPLFDGLSESAQGWYNTQGELMNGGKALSAPDGFISKRGAKPEKPEKEAKAAKGEKKAKAKREAPAKKAANAEKKEGVVSLIRRIQLANLDLSKAELAKLPELAGVSTGTLGVQFGFLRDTVAAIKASGHWK